MNEVTVCVDNKEGILKSLKGEILVLNEDGNYSQMKCDDADVTDLVNRGILVVDDVVEEDEEHTMNNEECVETEECYDAVETTVDSRELELRAEENKAGEIVGWTNAATELLISAVTELTPMVGNTIALKTKNQMWSQISKMLEENMYTFTPLQCKSKWNSVKRSFKNKIKNYADAGKTTWSDLDNMLVKNTTTFPQFTMHSPAGGKVDLRRRTSLIWRFFTPMTKTESICIICNKKFNASTITNLKTHIKRKHPKIKMDKVWRKEEGELAESKQQTPTSSVGNNDAVRVKLEEGTSSRLKAISDTPPAGPSTVESPLQQKKISFAEKLGLDLTPLDEKSKICLRRKTSVVWQFFTPLNEKESICNICNKKFNASTISNLKIHIKRKHPKIKIMSAKEMLEKQQTPTSSVSSIDTTVKYDTSASSLEPISFLSEPGPSTADSHPQTNKVGIVDKKELDDGLLMFFIEDFQPFSIVEDKGFRGLCNKLNPFYEIPSRKTLANTLLSSKYFEVCERVKNVVEDAVSVTITVETWTSCKNNSFLAVSAHFIDSNFVSKSMLLETIDLTVRDTSSNIASFLRRVVTEWGLEDKILLAVTDQETNIKKAIIEDLRWQHFDCLARTIDLIVRDGLKPLKPLIDKVKNIVSHYKNSLVAKAELEMYQKQCGKETKKILQPVANRWSSEFYMLERVIELKQDIQDTLTVNRKDNLPVITNEDFDVLEEIIDILAPMEAVTKNMNGEKYVTASSVIIITVGLKEVYQCLSEDLAYSTEVKEAISIIKNGIQKRLGSVESSKTLLISTFLDPRFKNIGFSSEEIGDQARTMVVNILANIVEKQLQPMQVDNPQTVGMNSEKRKKYDYWQAFDKKRANFQPLGTPRSRAVIEVQRYLEEPPLNRDLCPLNWWKTTGYNYPNLSKLVREKFGTAATSVPCEEMFSKTGKLLSDRRNRLSSTKVKQIMFINKNSGEC